MAYQATFKRYELKYLLTRQEKQNVLKSMAEHMKLDDYGRTTIRNIYFDTDTYRLIRILWKNRFIKKNYVSAAISRQDRTIRCL